MESPSTAAPPETVSEPAEDVPQAVQGDFSIPPRTRLMNHQARSSTTVHGGGAVLFGLLFFGVGMFVILMALDVIHAEDASFHVPREMVAAFGGLFALPGLWLMIHGVRGKLRERRFARASASSGGQAWTYEYPWDRTGSRRSGWRRVGSSLVGLMVFCGFLAPFHWLLFFSDENVPLFPKVIMGVFDLIILAMFVDFVKRIVQALRYGTTYVRWDRFPYFPGGKLRVALGFTRKPPAFEKLTVTLRAVEEAVEVSGTRGRRRERIVAYSVLESERVLTHGPSMPDAGRDAWFEFDVPLDAPGTDLAAQPPTYWEFAVHGEAPGADFEDVFLVPVYRGV